MKTGCIYFLFVTLQLGRTFQRYVSTWGYSYCFLFSSVSASTVSLTSNQAESGVCIEDRVVFTCAVTGPGSLEWGVESLFSFGTLDFNVFQDSPGIVPDPFPEVLNVTVLSTVQDSIHPVLGNLTSEITVLVTNTTLEKRVYCSDGILVEDESPSIVIRKKGTKIYIIS